MAGNIDFKFRTQELIGEYREAASRGIRLIATMVTEEIIDNITILDLIDTGAYRASVFFDVGLGMNGTSSLHRMATIGDATAKAHVPGKKSGRTFDFEPARELRQPKGMLDAKVGISANYAIFLEHGGMVNGSDGEGNAVGYIRHGGKVVGTAFDTVKPKADDVMRGELSKVK